MSSNAGSIFTPPWVVIRAIVSGLAIAFAGVLPWVGMAQLNATVLPNVPWAAALTLIWLAVMFSWLRGAWWPQSTSAFRQFHFRLWRPEAGAWRGRNLLVLLALVPAIAAFYWLWVRVTPFSPPDLAAYPTTEYRISVVVMGALVSGCVEEVAFRGYMQSQLERYGRTFAILLTSVFFVFAHLTHGFASMRALAVGYFMISVLYGLLAQRSGSVVPGMIIHSVGDVLYTYFAILNGDPNLLFVP